MQTSIQDKLQILIGKSSELEVSLDNILFRKKVRFKF